MFHKTDKIHWLETGQFYLCQWERERGLTSEQACCNIAGVKAERKKLKRLEWRAIKVFGSDLYIGVELDPKMKADGTLV